VPTRTALRGHKTDTMNRLLMLTGFALCSLSMGCGFGDHAHDHAHGTEASEPIPSLTRLVRSDSLELFVEFPAPVAGSSVAMAVHLSRLGDPMRPLTAATVVLFVDSLSGEKVTATPSRVEGLYLAEFPFRSTGVIRLGVEVHHASTNERLFVDDVLVYATGEEARSKAVPEEMHANAVRYTKELVWKSPFAVERLSRRPFADILPTGGELTEAPGEERLVTAQIAGVVAYATPGLVPGLTLRDGQALFEIRATDVELGELSAAASRAEEDFTVSKAQYERAQALAADRILSEKELLEARLRYEQARLEYGQRSTARTFSCNGSTIGQNWNRTPHRPSRRCRRAPF
jgi:cobalt-zinc-cadmium efflux system membrane fusion protein